MARDSHHRKDPEKRKEYLRNWQRAYRASHKNQIAETTRAKRDRDATRVQRSSSKSLKEFFNSEDFESSSIVGHDHVFRPWYKIISPNGKVTIEKSFEPLPTW